MKLHPSSSRKRVAFIYLPPSLPPSLLPPIKTTVNDSRAPDSYNAEFHLCELPCDLPPHLLRFVPNLHFSDSLGNRRYCVLVTAAKDLEVPVGGPPMELFVPYASPFGGVCKHGFPLL